MNHDLERVRQALRAEVESKPIAVPKHWALEALSLILVHLAVASVVALAWVNVLNERLVLRWCSALLLVAMIAVATLAAVIPKATRLRQAAGVLGVGGLVALCAMGLWIRAAYGYCESPSCAVGEVMISAVPGFVSVLILQRFAYQRERAVLGGLAAACTGLLALDLTCHIHSVSHIAVFHVLPCVAVVYGIAEIRRRLPSRTHVP
jgi:hypothetical protein